MFKSRLFLIVLHFSCLVLGIFPQEIQSDKPRANNNDERIKTKKLSKNENSEEVKRPNIILIITDDQDIELGSMEYMSETLKIFREGGTEFRHGYVTTPMCCPSRSSILTGLYVHNHNVYTNNDNCSSLNWRTDYESRSFASYLSPFYTTAYFGKYLNRYNGSHVPTGWTHWNALLLNSRFYNYTVNRGGVNRKYGNRYETDYYPELISNETVEFIRRYGEEEKDNRPFLLVVSYPSPHGPEDSAPQYSHLFFNSTSHHTPSYNFAPNSDKQWILQKTGPMGPNLLEFTNLLNAKRLQTLQSVDSGVGRIFRELEAKGLLDNTFIFYTSDHGYHVGQFGLIKGKAMPFEFDIRVPFFMRAPPKIKAPKIIYEPVLNIDLAPTFLELASISIPTHIDGRSLVPLFSVSTNERGGNFKILNSTNGRAENFKNLNYDQWRDVFLVESSGRREDLQNYFKKLEKKSNSNKSETKNLCDNFPYPCLKDQNKFCKLENGRVRFRKCRNFQINESECECDSDKIVKNRQIRSAENKNVSWLDEREKIDAEIENYKTKIDELRERKRELRKVYERNNKNKANESTLVKSYENTTEIRPHFENKKKNKIQVTILSTPKNKKTEAEDEEKVHREEEAELEDEIFKNTKFLMNESLKYKKFFNVSNIESEVKCHCEKILREREKEAKKKRRMLGKMRRKEKLLNKIIDPEERTMAENCGKEEKMNCFWHDESHWKTAPFWTGSPFCFCMNSINNSFTCLRSINSTHNYLYCSFITQFKMYFNLLEDPFQLKNVIHKLSESEERWMEETMENLKKCSGRDECSSGSIIKNSKISQESPLIYLGTQEDTSSSNIWEKIFGTRFKRKRNRKNGENRHHGTKSSKNSENDRN